MPQLLTACGLAPSAVQAKDAHTRMPVRRSALLVHQPGLDYYRIVAARGAACQRWPKEVDTRSPVGVVASLILERRSRRNAPGVKNLSQRKKFFQRFMADNRSVPLDLAPYPSHRECRILLLGKRLRHNRFAKRACGAMFANAVQLMPRGKADASLQLAPKGRKTSDRSRRQRLAMQLVN